MTQMNTWQKKYVDEYFDGKIPMRNKREMTIIEMLGKIKSSITVNIPERNGNPAHQETYIVTIDHCDMPNGFISVDVLASNLELWVLMRNWKVTTK